MREVYSRRWPPGEVDGAADVITGKRGQVALDRIRTVDKARLIRRLGRLEAGPAKRVLSVLGEMFAP